MYLILGAKAHASAWVSGHHMPFLSMSLIPHPHLFRCYELQPITWLSSLCQVRFVPAISSVWPSRYTVPINGSYCSSLDFRCRAWTTRFMYSIDFRNQSSLELRLIVWRAVIRINIVFWVIYSGCHMASKNCTNLYTCTHYIYYFAPSKAIKLRRRKGLLRDWE